MALSRGAIEAAAPDQGALTAAAALLKPAKWPLRAQSGSLIWGECQGSGANPYRVAADVDDLGCKCTCPSRKFPCKHGLALMWMYVDAAAGFAAAPPPDWVLEWVGRRRKVAAAPAAPPGAGAAAASPAKSLVKAGAGPEPAAVDPEAEAKRAAAKARRAADTRRQVAAGLDELEVWIGDQLRTGLMGFVGDASDRCRRIAARLVDAKAAALASRIDEAPARLFALPPDERADAAIAELGKLTLAMRAWRAAPEDTELHREVIGAETREEVLSNPASPRAASTWEVLAERITTRRDGLVSVATWLINLRPAGPRFALLLDFFPASAGRRGGAFAVGQTFEAELAFYASRWPLRAVIAARGETTEAPDGPWPAAATDDPLRGFAEVLLATPWRLEAPILLPPGRIGEDGAGRAWWVGGEAALPIDISPPAVALGAELEAAAGLWNGARLSLLSARASWGRLGFDG
jgi:hypothetical protein